MPPHSDLRAEAEALARQLPNLNFKAEASEAAHIGSAGRRRAGNGEQGRDNERANADVLDGDVDVPRAHARHRGSLFRFFR